MSRASELLDTVIAVKYNVGPGKPIRIKSAEVHQYINTTRLDRKITKLHDVDAVYYEPTGFSNIVGLIKVGNDLYGILRGSRNFIKSTDIAISKFQFKGSASFLNKIMDDFEKFFAKKHIKINIDIDEKDNSLSIGSQDGKIRVDIVFDGKIVKIDNVQSIKGLGLAREVMKSVGKHSKYDVVIEDIASQDLWQRYADEYHVKLTNLLDRERWETVGTTAAILNVKAEEIQTLVDKGKLKVQQNKVDANLAAKLLARLGKLKW